MRDLKRPEKKIIEVSADECGTWVVHVESRVYVSDAEVSAFSGIPEIRASIYMLGKHVEPVMELRSTLSTPTWREATRRMADLCVTNLIGRDVDVLDSLQVDLEEAVVAAWKTSVLMVVRHQASSLVDDISATDVANVWFEEDARFVMDS